MKGILVVLILMVNCLSQVEVFSSDLVSEEEFDKDLVIFEEEEEEEEPLEDE